MTILREAIYDFNAEAKMYNHCTDECGCNDYCYTHEDCGCNDYCYTHDQCIPNNS